VRGFFCFFKSGLFVVDLGKLFKAERVKLKNNTKGGGLMRLDSYSLSKISAVLMVGASVLSGCATTNSIPETRRFSADTQSAVQNINGVIVDDTVGIAAGWSSGGLMGAPEYDRNRVTPAQAQAGNGVQLPYEPALPQA